MSTQPSGELCDVRKCANLQVRIADVPLFRASGRTIELALCIEHLADLHNADDPIELCRQWLFESVRP